MSRSSLYKTVCTVAGLMTLASLPVEACTVCMGDPDSKFAEATNAAIFLMLGVIGGVLGLLSAFAIYLHRRASAPLPPHCDLDADANF